MKQWSNNTIQIHLTDNFRFVFRLDRLGSSFCTQNDDIVATLAGYLEVSAPDGSFEPRSITIPHSATLVRIGFGLMHSKQKQCALWYPWNWSHLNENLQGRFQLRQYEQEQDDSLYIHAVHVDCEHVIDEILRLDRQFLSRPPELRKNQWRAIHRVPSYLRLLGSY